MGLGWVHWGSGGVTVNFSSGPSINFWGLGASIKFMGAIHKLMGWGPGLVWGGYGASMVGPDSPLSENF